MEAVSLILVLVFLLGEKLGVLRRRGKEFLKFCRVVIRPFSGFGIESGDPGHALLIGNEDDLPVHGEAGLDTLLRAAEIRVLMKQDPVSRGS